MRTSARSTLNSHAFVTLSILATLLLGPISLIAGYRGHVMYGAAAHFYFLVSAVIIPAIVVCGGEYKILTWQAAAISLALSVAIDDLRLEANIGPHLKEYAGIAFGFWAISTVLSAPLPIFWFLRDRRSRK